MRMPFGHRIVMVIDHHARQVITGSAEHYEVTARRTSAALTVRRRC